VDLDITINKRKIVMADWKVQLAGFIYKKNPEMTMIASLLRDNPLIDGCCQSVRLLIHKKLSVSFAENSV